MKFIRTPGQDALWNWFGLSYASWLVLPRCLMHAMSDDWQGKMAALLREFNATFEDKEGNEYCVQARRNGKIVKMPDWADRSFYRHPQKDVIDSMRVAKP